MDKVAIIGGAPPSQMDAPFDDMDWDIFVLGNQLSDYDGKRVDKVFEIHDDLFEHPDEYPDWLRKHSPYLIVGKEFPGASDEIYPEKEVTDILNCLSSSIAYMMGYAILNGYKEISIYGVEMAIDDHEYFKQRPDMYAWIGYAKGRGIKINIRDESSLFTSTYVEGRDWGKGSDEGHKPFTYQQLHEMAVHHQDKIKEKNIEIDKLKMSANAHAGASNVYEHLANVARSLESGVVINTLKDVTALGK